ncbi:MAG: glycosyltransferase [Myxococcota bacterium]
MRSDGSGRPLRLLLVGAFRYPHDQGSQIYFQEQAIALRAAGAEVDLLTYGPTREADAAQDPASDLAPRSWTPGGEPADPDRWRALDGFEHGTIPHAAAPRSARSGPHLDKPLADLALAWAIRRRIRRAGRDERAAREPFDPPGRCARRANLASAEDAALDASWITPRSASTAAPSEAAGPSASASFRASSRRGSDPTVAPSGSERPCDRSYDAILAHHAEATIAALIACAPRVRAGPPILYCAHTLLEEELPTYGKSVWSRILGRIAPAPTGDDPETADARRRARALAGMLASCGRVLDARLARHASGWIALTRSAERVMRASSARPGARIAPPMPDPCPLASRAEREHTVRRLGLEPGRYFLYSGNLDPYQDLPLLYETARRREGTRPDAPTALPIVVATHGAQGVVPPPPGFHVIRVGRVAQAQALIATARATLIPRLGLGGFPIKLANSLAAGTPVVALHDAEWGLADGREALIGDRADPAGSLARALARLECDDALAARLGRGARATWQRAHAPPVVARATLALIETLIASSR